MTPFLRGLTSIFLVALVVSACAPAAPAPPTSTPTLAATATSTALPTPTQTPQPTPTPVLVSAIQDAVLYSGPGKAGYEEIAPLPAGTNVQPLGKFVDYVLVRLYGAEKPEEGYVPMVMLGELPQDLPALAAEQVPWMILKDVTADRTVWQENSDGKRWAEPTLARNLKFSDGLQIKLNIESTKGRNGILLLSNPYGSPWWKGHRRMELFYINGELQISLRDGTQEQTVYDRSISLGTINGVTSGELIMLFDKYGKNLQILRDNKLVLDMGLAQVGDFPDGLFPEGQISKVQMSTAPGSTGTLTELVFLVPPDGKHK